MEEESQAIAIIGMAFEFPGDARSEEGFWQMLQDGKSASTDFPVDRLNIEAYFHPDTNRPGTIPVRGGNFLQEDLAAFDAPFFSITPAEAACMDPQHRRMLETAYHALEDAGMPISQCAGTNTSVYTGCFTNDYLSILQQDYESEQRHAAMGIAPSMLANRLSWFFNFKGISMNLDSACSSSLLALHLACQELRAGGSTLALVCGANLIYHPNFMKMMSDFNFLSPDSCCRSFDHKANGYARGEGFVTLVVKRLDDALRDGDTVRAVIRGTGSNQDGRTPGITQPSQQAQVELIRSTYQHGKIDMGPTRFFEAHGTGTPLGDPIEANAIGTAFLGHRTSKDPLYLGATKSNIGHLEGASGLAGIVKTVLVLEKGVIPPIANFTTLNPKIDGDKLSLSFPQTAVAWPSPGLRRACINSFGFGGTNATAILDDAYHYMKLRGLQGDHRTLPQPELQNGLIAQSSLYLVKDCISGETPRLLIWSASDESVLPSMSAMCCNYINQNLRRLEDVAFTLSARRSEFRWRSFAVASGDAGFNATSMVASKPNKALDNPRCAFAFTGQGAQYKLMGLDLHQYAVYADSLLASQECLALLGYEWSVVKMLQGGYVDVDLDEPAISQPLTTILQIALCDLLKSFNIGPDVVIGHSSGEISAAYAAGALTRHAAIKVAYYRGVLSSKLASQVRQRLSMVAVGISKSDAMQYLSRLSKVEGAILVHIGCINSPNSVTLTGDLDQLHILLEWFKEDSVFARKLRVPVAYHSPYMSVIADEYERLLGCLDYETKAQQIPMISSVTGDFIPQADLRTSQYWIRNLTSTVKFETAITRLVAQTGRRVRKKLGKQQDIACSHILEIGPHSALRGPIRDILQKTNSEAKLVYMPSLVRGQDSRRILLEAVGTLYCAGHAVNLLAANLLEGHRAPIPPNLPKYPFNHSHTYWRESRLSRNMRFPRSSRHDLLGTRSLDWNKHVAQWRNIIRISDIPWIQDHRIGDDIVFPAAAMIAMALESFIQISRDERATPPGAVLLKNVAFLHPITFLLGRDSAETQLTLSRGSQATSESPWACFRLFVIENNEYVECCSGQICESTEIETSFSSPLGFPFLQGKSCREWADDISALVEPESEVDCYSICTGSKVKYGLAFQGLHGMRLHSNGYATALLDTEIWRCRDSQWPGSYYPIHPATLDGLAQVVVPALHRKLGHLPTMVPSRISNICINLNHDALRNGEISVTADCGIRGQRGASANIVALTPDSPSPLIILEGLETTFIGGEEELKVDELQRTLCTRLIWGPDIELMDNEQILEYCTTHRPKQHHQAVEDYKALNTAIMCFVEEAIQFADHEIAIALPNHLEYYVQWLRYQHKRLLDGVSSVDKEKVTELLADDSARQNLTRTVGVSSVEGHFFMHLGRHLIKILRGDSDPLQLIFGDDLADRYYEAMLANEHHSYPTSAYIELVCLKNPSMTILEVGAGTGRQTLRLLESMSKGGTRKWQRYDYTDISAGFFGQAREKFRDYADKMMFRVCDISQDLVSQLFEDESYDLVVASHVLHATNSLQGSLRNIRRLLKPDGKLLLFETTVPDTISIGFAFGLLKGWWDPLDNEPRSILSPCLTSAAWDDELRKAGFSGIDVDIPGQEEIECRFSSIIISTAISQGVPAVHQGTDRTIAVILNPEVRIQWEIAEAMEESAHRSQTNLRVHTLSDNLEGDTVRADVLISLLEIDSVFLHDILETDYNALKSVLLQNKTVIWVTRATNTWSEPQHHLADGLGRTLMSEDSTRKFTTLSLERSNETPTPIADTVMRVVDKVFSSPVEQLENNYILKQCVLHTNRIVEQPEINGKVARAIPPRQQADRRTGGAATLTLRLPSLGDPQSAEWYQDTAADELIELTEDEIVVDVRAIGLSGRDRLVALGTLDDETKLGTTECSGTVIHAGDKSSFQPGDRVCVLHHSTNHTRIRVPGAAAASIPDDMGFATAASLPTALCLAYYSLVDLARLSKGETVLIYDGHSCFGQLAIQIATKLGAIVLATTSSENKQGLLPKRFQLPESSILPVDSSRFPKGLYNATHGRKVDVVVGAFPRDLVAGIAHCLKPFSRLVNISLQQDQSHMPSAGGFRNISMSSVDLVGALRADPTRMFSVFQRAFRLALDWDIQPPVEIHTLCASMPKDALSHFLDIGVVGKRVIELREDTLLSTNIPTESSTHLRDDATYIIGGGLGGLGRTFARWMVQRGARNLVLLSRSGPTSDAAKTLITELHDQGVAVLTPTVDIGNLKDLIDVVNHVNELMPPIRGCIQATVALRDNLFENMTYSDWTLSTRSKVHGSWNLHAALPPGLDFFVLVSSINGIFGGRAQANYAAGNTFKDALAHHRIDQGEKAVSIDLGLMVTEGVVAENEFLLESMRRIGHLMEIQQEELIALLDIYCDAEMPLLSHDDAQVLVGIELPALVLQKGIDLHHSIRRPIFRHLFSVSAPAGRNAQIDPSGTLISREMALKEAATLDEETALVVEWFTGKIAQVLGLKEDDIDRSKSINVHGIDSLVAIDLKNWMHREVGAEMEVFVLLGNISLEELCREAVGKSTFFKEVDGKGKQK